MLAGSFWMLVGPGGEEDEEVGLVLGIETSCDETAAAVVDSGREILSSVVSSQVRMHERFGGVVPEVASRAHVELLDLLVVEALASAGLDPLAPGLEAVAATTAPGLAGALLVGVSEAKAFAMAYGVPFVAVNHLEGHLFASLLDAPETEFPLLVLLVSGGHTLLVEMSKPGGYRVLGRTLDDAAGEAFDKVSRFLGLGYPGGPAIEKAAAGRDPSLVVLPRPMLDKGNLRDGWPFSFSGLKTAAINYVKANPGVDSADVAAGFQAAVVDVLANRCKLALEATGASGLALAGGVAANGALRRRLQELGEEMGVSVHMASRAMCTDNAAMIAAAGFFRLCHDGPSSLSTGIEPSAGLFGL